MNNTIIRKVSKDKDNQLSLTYEFSTNPTPISVSPPEGDAQKAIISLVISNNTKKDISLNSIFVSLPIGDKSTDLTYNMEDDISIYSESDEYKIGKKNSTNTIYIINKDENRDPFGEEELDCFEVKSKKSIFLVITCKQVSKLIGDFAITIVENKDEKTDNEVSSKFFFPKLPYGFYLNSFRAEPPVVKYSEGGEHCYEEGYTGKDCYATELCWNGARSSKIKYSICSNLKIDDENNTISDKNNKDAEWTEVDTNSFEIKALQKTTVFSLRAEYKNFEGADLEYYLQTVVFVINSDINATNIKAKSIEVVEDIKAKSIEVVEDIKAKNIDVDENINTKFIDIKEYAKINNTLYVDKVKSTETYEEENKKDK